MTAEFMLTGPDAASPRVTRHRAFRFAVLGLAMVGLAGCDTVTGIFTSDDQTVLPGERLSVMELGAVLEVDPAVAYMEIELPPARANADWPQPGGVPSNAMHHLEAPGTFARAWSANAGSGSSGAARLVAVPVIVGERIYVLDARGSVRAMERQSGRTVWTVSLVPKNENAAEARGGGIAYDDGKIFVTTGFGNVHALDPAGGADLWVQAIGDPFRAAPTATDGRIFAVTADNQMICISQDSGEVLWRHRGIVESAGILTSTSPAVSGAVVIAPYSSGELVALRVENGTPVWSDSLTRTGNVTSLSELNDIAGRPVIDRNRVIAVSHSGRMVSIDLRTGERVWTRHRQRADALGRRRVYFRRHHVAGTSGELAPRRPEPLAVGAAPLQESRKAHGQHRMERTDTGRRTIVPRFLGSRCNNGLTLYRRNRRNHFAVGRRVDPAGRCGRYGLCSDQQRDAACPAIGRPRGQCLVHERG